MVASPKNYHYLEGTTKPTTIIYGDHDMLIGLQNLPRLLKQNPQITAIKTAGRHGISREKYTQIAKVLESLIKTS